MKTITKILLTISIILGTLTTAAILTIDSIERTEAGILINFNTKAEYIETATEQPIFEVTNILYESNDNIHLEANDIYIEFNNGSWAIANEQTNTYIFQPAELGDWDYSDFDSLEDFENCIKTYASIKNTGSY